MDITSTSTSSPTLSQCLRRPRVARALAPGTCQPGGAVVERRSSKAVWWENHGQSRSTSLFPPVPVYPTNKISAGDLLSLGGNVNGLTIDSNKLPMWSAGDCLGNREHVRDVFHGVFSLGKIACSVREMSCRAL